jgi:hypothetical protein
VNKKPPELPNIEDATLRACLAPLMEAMHAGAETMSQPRLATSAASAQRPQRVPRGLLAGSNDNPVPSPAASGCTNASAAIEYPGAPKTLAEWRSLADDEFGAFRMIELFLVMTDAELTSAAGDFPKQFGGTVARLARIKRRLAAQYDTVTTAMALLQRAMARVAAEPGGH